MKNKKLTLFFLLIIGALILSACAGGRTFTNNFPGLAADNERAYISTGSLIYAVDVQSGREVWRYPEDPGNEFLYYANPVLTEDGQLIIGSAGTNHTFVSLDPATGQENWAKVFSGVKGAWLASPLVFNDTIYAPNTDGYLYIVDLEGNQSSPPIQLGGALWSAPVTDGTYIYINSLDHHLHILNPETGEHIDPVNLGGAAPGSPTIGENGVYAGSFSSDVKFITPDGKSEVIASAPDWIWGTPVFDNETLYYADLSGNVFSLDLTNNRHNWDSLKPDGPVTAKLLVVGDQIYVATEAGSFFALDRDGKIVWEKTSGGKIYTTPVLANDLILVAPYQADFALAAYDADGKQAWTFKPGN